MKDFEYSCLFSAQANLIDPTEAEINEALASNKQLASLLPEDINPEDEPDLLYIAADLAVAGLINKNDDCLLPHDAVAVYKNFEKKPCNIEHNRGHMCGYILKAYLRDMESGEVLTEEQALASNKPFYITTVAVIWKVANKELPNLIISASDPSSPNYQKVSLSFEMGFTSFSIIVSDGHSAFGATIVKNGEDGFEQLKGVLRVFGGNGKIEDKKISRALAGKIVPLGQGIVGDPAAQVKGIEAITQKPEDEQDEPAEDDNDEIEAIDMDVDASELQKFLMERFIERVQESKINDNLNKNGVSKNVEFTKAMKIQGIKQLEEKWDEIVKSEQALASVKTLFADVIAAEGEKFAKELADEKQKLAQASEEKDRLSKAQADLTKQLEQVQKELDTLKAAQAAAEAEQKFNERMAFISDEYALDDEEKALITEEIRSLDEEAFAKWQKKAKVIMKEKSKAAKAQKKKDMEQSMCKAGVKVVIDDETLEFKEIIASAKQVEQEIPNNVIVNGEDLRSLVEKAFAPENVGFGKK